jgi:hypothetical protein
MGMVLPGKSKWRALSEAETEIYGGSSIRRLYGCVFNMQCAAASGSLGTTSKETIQEKEQQLLTWSQVLHSQASSPTEQTCFDHTIFLNISTRCAKSS